MTALSTVETLRDTPSLTLSARTHHVVTEPFPHFWVDNYLPPATYRALLETFPTDADFVGQADASKHGNKRILSSSHQRELFEAFLGRQPAWRTLFETLGSDAFIGDLYGLVRPDLLRARGLGGLRRWRAGHVSSLLRQGVEFHVEFSRMTEGSYILPHTDTPGKLASLLLYFPDREWRPDFGGGTVFYRPGQGAPRRNWGNQTVPFEAVVPASVVEFVANRLVVFIKSSTSYHAVPRVACPPDMLRNSVNINYLIPREGSA